jgi:hypothetical protein
VQHTYFCRLHTRSHNKSVAFFVLCFWSFEFLRLWNSFVCENKTLSIVSHIPENRNKLRLFASVLHVTIVEVPNYAQTSDMTFTLSDFTVRGRKCCMSRGKRLIETIVYVALKFKRFIKPSR